jgi:hypothetical protein
MLKYAYAGEHLSFKDETNGICGRMDGQMACLFMHLMQKSA